MAADKSSSKGQAWFCTTGLPSDIVVEVVDMTFHLHKFPLMSKSRKFHQLITEQETNSPAAKDQTTASCSITTEQQHERQQQNQNHEIVEEHAEELEEEGEDHCHIALPDFPGGSYTFEMASKFCYGVKIDLSSSTVVPLRCAGEFLEMAEEYSEDNLISKTERFLSQCVFQSPRDSVKALKSCECVMPLAESLGITQRCIDAIACRASSADPALFGWPVSDGVNELNQALWNGVEVGLRRKNLMTNVTAESWFEDLAQLSLALFKHLILAMRAQDLSAGIIESCLMYYARTHVPGISSRSSRKLSSSSIASEHEQREVLETIISNLPLEKSSRSSMTTRVLFGLLRTANILNASEACRTGLEKKIGSQLEEATLDDLLIPSFSYLNETLYDVDCVERMLGYFLEDYVERKREGMEANADAGDRWVRSPAMMVVGKLIDGYLSEIASDANLKPEKMYNLATSLPDEARLFDDGLYRAVDVYLKAHPWIEEAEREKISGVMECQKLTLEACTHAAQNERLPLRAVVQVLFLEQVQLRQAIAGSLLAGESSLMQREEEEEGGEEEGRMGWRAAVRENQVLRLDMDSMRTRVHQLERECSTMKKVIEKIDEGGRGGKKGWSLNRKLGCKFKTQVCDSQESTVVDRRKGRTQQQQQ